VTRAEAEARCAGLNGAREEGDPMHWMAREGEDGWEVVRVNVPGLDARGPLKETSEARLRPPTPDNPAVPDWKIAPPG
jgi:hypothetical protein